MHAWLKCLDFCNFSIINFTCVMGKIFIKYYIYSSEIFQNASIVYGFNLPTEKDLQRKKLSVVMKVWSRSAAACCWMAAEDCRNIDLKIMNFSLVRPLFPRHGRWLERYFSRYQSAAFACSIFDILSVILFFVYVKLLNILLRQNTEHWRKMTKRNLVGQLTLGKNFLCRLNACKLWVFALVQKPLKSFF